MVNKNAKLFCIIDIFFFSVQKLCFYQNSMATYILNLWVWFLPPNWCWVRNLSKRWRTHVLASPFGMTHSSRQMQEVLVSAKMNENSASIIVKVPPNVQIIPCHLLPLNWWKASKIWNVNWKSNMNWIWRARYEYRIHCQCYDICKMLLNLCQ